MTASRPPDVLPAAKSPAAGAHSAALPPRTVPTRGRNHITARALNNIVAAITAEALGVPARQVGVQLGDAGGLLRVTVTAPISVPTLTARRHADGVGAAGSIMTRATTAQATIREQVLRLTGSAVGRVTLRLNDAQLGGEERVQ